MKSIAKGIGSKLWRFTKWFFKTLFKFTIGCIGLYFLIYVIGKTKVQEEYDDVTYDGYTYKIRKGSKFDKDLAFKGDYYDDKEFVELLKQEES